MSGEVLLVGGAGYIGSHMLKSLLGAGIGVVTLDNLSTSHRDAVMGGEFVEGDLGDRALLDRLLSVHQFDAVMHFAAFIQVGESVAQPAQYYENNVSKTLVLLDAMRAHGVSRFIFSSSAAVYGIPERVPIVEAHPKRPINPYGKTKWVVEEILADYDRAYGLHSVSLRYFNAAGADPAGTLRERHAPETHLIPLVLMAAAGARAHVTVYGDDYATPDGTCIRDYVHVVDLCDAHLAALRYLQHGGASAAFNLGNGEGFSVRQLIDTARAVTGREIRVVIGPRRAGDPPRLVADSRLAREVLHWRPRYGSLETIIAHAWAGFYKD